MPPKLPIIEVVEGLEKLQQQMTAQDFTGEANAPAPASAHSGSGMRKNSLLACFPAKTKVAAIDASIEGGTAKLQKNVQKNISALLLSLFPTAQRLNDAIKGNAKARRIADEDNTKNAINRRLQFEIEQRKIEVARWNKAATKAKSAVEQVLMEISRSMIHQSSSEFDEEHKLSPARAWLQAWRIYAEPKLSDDLCYRLHEGLDKHGRVDPNIGIDDEVDNQGYRQILDVFIDPSYEADPKDMAKNSSIEKFVTLTQMIEKDYLDEVNTLRNEDFFKELSLNDIDFNEALILLNGTGPEIGTIDLVAEIAQDCGKQENLQIALEFFLDMLHTLKHNLDLSEQAQEPFSILEVSKILTKRLQKELNDQTNLSVQQQKTNQKLLDKIQKLYQHHVLFLHKNCISEPEDCFFGYAENIIKNEINLFYSQYKSKHARITRLP